MCVEQVLTQEDDTAAEQEVTAAEQEDTAAEQEVTVAEQEIISLLRRVAASVKQPDVQPTIFCPLAPTCQLRTKSIFLEAERSLPRKRRKTKLKKRMSTYLQAE